MLHLKAGKAMTSQPSCCMSTGRAPKVWAASTTVTIPRSRASAETPSTGSTMPRSVVTWLKQIARVLGVMACSMSRRKAWSSPLASMATSSRPSRSRSVSQAR